MGIGSLSQFSNTTCYVPKDKDTARIGGRTKSPRYGESFTKFYLMDIYEEPSDYQDRDIGYIFHTYCWKILGHILGNEVIEKNPEVIIRAARRRWRDWGLWGIDDLQFMFHRDNAEAGAEDENLSDDELVGELFNHPDAKLEKPEDYAFNWVYDDLLKKWEHPRDWAWGCNIYSDPWIVPEVQKAIQLARETPYQRPSSYLSTLPQDICVLIAEFICPIESTRSDVQNTRNMLSIFAWNLPKAFWKRRLQTKEYPFFEVDLLDEADTLNWQALWLNLMSLLSDKAWFTSSGLANRKRVLRSINSIVSHYRRMG